MSNDPFSEFSKTFATEFGRAMMSAWQETLSKSAASGFSQMLGANASPSAANPFEMFQQFLNQFPGFDRADLGAGNDYLNFGNFIKQYLDMFSAGADASSVAAQMNDAFQQSVNQFSKTDAASWMNMFQQLGHLDGAANFFDIANNIFAKSAGGFPGLDSVGTALKFDFSEFTHGKTAAALGPAREWQIAMEDVYKAADRFRSAQEVMSKHTLSTFEGANERFWRDMGKGDDELNTLKEIYDYWVNCAEEEYYENVMSDEYSRDFGEAINSQADFKVKFTALVDRFLEMLNIPNRREINGIIEQLATIEARLEKLERFGGDKASVDDATTQTESALKELRDRIQILETHPNASPLESAKKDKRAKAAREIASVTAKDGTKAKPKQSSKPKSANKARKKSAGKDAGKSRAKSNMLSL